MEVKYIKETLSPNSQKYVALALLKFGSEKRIKEFQETGTIFCKAIQDLRTGKDDFRFDSYEGISTVEGCGPGLLTVKLPTGEVMELKVNEASYTTHFEQTFGNVCSFYSLSELNFGGKNSTIIDKRMTEFGSHALLIKDVGEFQRRIKRKAEELQIKSFTAFVEYYDPYKHKGDINIFQKRSEYGYQREVRLFINRSSIDHFKFDIGNISDISEIFTSAIACQLQFNVKRKSRVTTV